MDESTEFFQESNGYKLALLNHSRWDDFVRVLGKGGIGGCWCMYWISPNSATWGEGTRGGSKGANKTAFMQLVEDGPPPGILAYHHGEPIAWCRVMARERLLGLANSRYFKTTLDTTDVWSLSCFVVRPKYRGRGLVTILTEAAASYARIQGARFLEVYPWDTEEQKYPGVVFTGVASTFSRLGFEVVQRKAQHKPMMRLAL